MRFTVIAVIPAALVVVAACESTTTSDPDAGIGAPDARAVRDGALVHDGGRDAGPPDPGTIADHPRLILTPARLAELRESACVSWDDDGSVSEIPSCTPSSDWVAFRDWIAVCYADSGDCYTDPPWQYALRYMITGEVEYATRAIEMIEGEIADGLEAERTLLYLYADDYVGDAALAFDWLGEFLSPEQKARFARYMNRVVQEIYVERSDDNLFNPGTRWAVGAITNNYYYSFLLTVALAGLATAGENDLLVENDAGEVVPLALFFHERDTVHQDMVEFLLAKLEESALPDWVLTNCAGGAWHEGNQYGTGMRLNLSNVFSLIRDALGYDYFSRVPFMRESVHYQLFALEPGLEYLEPLGDGNRDKSFAVSAYERQFFLLASDALAGTPEGSDAQWVVDHVYPEPFTSQREQLAWQFLFHRAGREARDFRSALPRSYFASGMGWVNSRSGWDEGTSVGFISSDPIEEHQHQEQNAFTIYRGDGDREDWLAIDAVMCPDSNGDNANATEHHNTILLGDPATGEHDALQQVYAGDGSFDRDIGEITRYQEDPRFTFMAGEAAGAYRHGAGMWTSMERKLDSFTREIVHVFPDVVVVHDRVVVDPTYRAAIDVTYALNLWSEPAHPEPGLLVATSGTGKLFQRTLLPETFDYSTADSLGCRRVEITSRDQAQHELLHVIVLDDASATSMPATTRVSSAGGELVGAAVAGSRPLVLLFSQSGSPFERAEWSVSASGALHVVSGLTPDRGYRLGGAALPSVATATAGAGGVISFTTSSTGTVTLE